MFNICVNKMKFLMASTFETPIQYWQPSTAHDDYRNFALAIQQLVDLQSTSPEFQNFKPTYFLRKTLQALVISIQESHINEISVDDHTKLFIALLIHFGGPATSAKTQPNNSSENLTCLALALLVGDLLDFSLSTGSFTHESPFICIRLH